jgi:hypothetical protein
VPSYFRSEKTDNIGKYVKEVTRGLGNVHSERFIIYDLQEILSEFAVLRVVIPCGLVEIHQRYRGALHPRKWYSSFA